MMKKDAIIVNCARGGIINEQDLYEALFHKKIRGACLDVFDQEPVNINNPLLTLDTVYVSAHNAGSSLEGKNRVVWDAMKNVIDIHNGLIPKGVVNPWVL
jgi:D-3-phosphoglycerate dehydrogenase